MGERERERQVERKRSVSSPCGQSCLPTRRRAPIPRCTNGSPGSFFFFLFFFSFSVLTKVEITSRLQTFCSTLISRCNQVYTCLPEFRVNLWDVGQTCFFSPGNPLETGRILWRCFEFRLGRTKKKMRSLDSSSRFLCEWVVVVSLWPEAIRCAYSLSAPLDLFKFVCT